MSFKRSAAIAMLVAFLFMGCGEKIESGRVEGETAVAAGSPQDAFYLAQKCLKEERFEDLFGLLSATARDDFVEGLRQSAKVRSNQPFVRSVMGVDASELAKLPPAEAFARTLRVAQQASGTLERIAGSEGGSVLHEEARVERIDAEGDRARLTAVYVSGRTAVHELVLENGQWKLTSVPKRPQ